MSVHDNGGPAFPTKIGPGPDGGFQCGNELWQAPGMTLSDYFAAKAMQGMQSNFGANDWTATKFAQRAYEQADAMLRARNA